MLSLLMKMDASASWTFGWQKSYRATRHDTLCGAADYLAPEQVTCTGHGLPVDFWGLGVLLWEISAGEGPWGKDPNELNIYKRITDHTCGSLRSRLDDIRSKGFLLPMHSCRHLLI